MRRTARVFLDLQTTARAWWDLPLRWASEGWGSVWTPIGKRVAVQHSAAKVLPRSPQKPSVADRWMGPSFHQKILQQLGTVWLPRAEQVLQRPGHDLVFVAAPWGQQPNQEWHCSWPKPNLLACQLLEWSISLERSAPRFALNGQHEYLSIFPNYFSLVNMQQNPKKPDLPRGAEWMTRGAYAPSLRIQTAPFGKCWYETTTFGYLWYLYKSLPTKSLVPLVTSD